MVVPVMPSLLVLLSPPTSTFCSALGPSAVLSFLLLPLPPSVFLGFKLLYRNNFQIYVSTQIPFLNVNCPTNSFTCMCNWHFDLTLSKQNTWFPPQISFFLLSVNRIYILFVIRAKYFEVILTSFSFTYNQLIRKTNWFYLKIYAELSLPLHFQATLQQDGTIPIEAGEFKACLLYTSDAADEDSSV